MIRGLGERGIVVRGGEGLGGPGHIRVTYGTRAENERFLAALGEGLAAEPRRWRHPPRPLRKSHAPGTKVA